MNAQARRMLIAVEDLLSYYRDKDASGRYDCPLCSASGADCDACPWVVLLRKRDCMSLPFSVVDRRMCPSPQWRAASIHRLTKWVAQIKRGTYERRLKKANP